VEHTVGDILRDPVALQVEKPDGLRNFPQMRRYFLAPARCVIQVRRQVEARDYLIGSQMIHQI
jgi:hypothetical protein